MSINEVIGKYCNLELLLKEFPRMYAVMQDVKKDGAIILGGTVVDIIDVESIREYQKEHLMKMYHYEYLGEDEFGGYIDVEGYTITLE